MTKAGLSRQRGKTSCPRIRFSVATMQSAGPQSLHARRPRRPRARSEMSPSAALWRRSPQPAFSNVSSAPGRQHATADDNDALACDVENPADDACQPAARVERCGRRSRPEFSASACARSGSSVSPSACRASASVPMTAALAVSVGDAPVHRRQRVANIHILVRPGLRLPLSPASVHRSRPSAIVTICAGLLGRRSPSPRRLRGRRSCAHPKSARRRDGCPCAWMKRRPGWRLSRRTVHGAPA